MDLNLQQILRRTFQYINIQRIMEGDQKTPKENKDLKLFKKYINSQLKEFQKCREWADINNWLHNLYKHLQNKHFQELPNSVLMAKRLAQCLTNTLPSGVHQYALRIYTLILTNFDDQQNIKPLMSIGLFPFFQVSSSQLKFQLLKIYEKFFLNDSGCIQMVISLMNSLLTGLNQNNEELAKKIFAICEKMSKKYGYIWVDGAVWVNILKSPKVKIAGFKYFMKAFKERDKQKNNQQQIIAQKDRSIKQLEQLKKQQLSKKSFLENAKKKRSLKQEEMNFLMKLIEKSSIQEGKLNRFPNFSTLVVSAIRSCLEGDVDSLIKRAALEHIGSYLKLEEIIQSREYDALVLVSSMLKVLICKQFSLTRRIYLYLFDQPNADGQYTIDPSQRKLQIKILISSIKRMLRQSEESGESHYHEKEKNFKLAQSTLSIIQILIQDHQKLGEIILPQLTYDILRFLKNRCFTANNMILNEMRRKILEFNESIIVPFNSIFLQSILIKVVREHEKQKINEKYQQEDFNQKKNEKQFIEVIKILEFYIYTLYKTKYQTNSGYNYNKGSIKKSTSSNEEESSNQITEQLKQICLTTINKILSFLIVSKFKYEKLNYEALDLANKINTQTLSKIQGFRFNQNLIGKIDDLINLDPPQPIFARLLTLHPCPKKQILLPFINQGPFAIVCLQNLLPLNPIHSLNLNQDQQKRILHAVFKLMECHLWEQQAYELLKTFILQYQKTFQQQIDKIQGSQWLIYWRLAQGNVKGGIIRMILNAQSQNPLKKHMSSKWIQANDHIISKIIQPIYTKLNKCLQNYENYNSEEQLQKEINLIYELLRIVFETSQESFDRFFFLQKQKYLNPLLEMIFLNLELGRQKMKTKSMEMMKYVLSKAQSYQQKYDYMNLTIGRVLSIFKALIIRKMGSEEMENQVLEKKLDKLSRISSFQKSDTQLYLQEIQIIEYMGNLNVSIRNSLKDKQFKSQSIIELFESKGMYVQVIKGLFQSDLPYLRTLYLDFLKDSCDLLARIQKSRDLLNLLVNLILDKLFLILKTQDVSKIQETIRDKKDSNNLKASIHRTRRLSSADLSEDLQLQKVINLTKDPTSSFFIAQKNISKNDMNIQAKYAQLIEMWNSVKFFTKFSIEKGINNLPIVNLLSLILQSFPFSYLKYCQVSNQKYSQSINLKDGLGIQQNENENYYEILQEEIGKVTGLKKEVMEIIEIVWSKFNVEICEFLIQRGDPRILIHCSIDPIRVFWTLNSSSTSQEIGKYYTKGAKLSLPKNYYHYSGQMLNKQNQINYFIYLYLLYCNFTLIPSKKLNSFLELLLSLMRTLRLSHHIQSKLWTLELIHLISQRLIDFSAQTNQKVKTQLQQLTKQTLQHLTKTINRIPKFTYKTQIKNNFISNLFSKQQIQQSTFDFIKMNPPTIFKMSQIYTKRNNKRHNLSQSNKQAKDIPNQSWFENIKPEMKNQNELIESFLFEKWLNLSEQVYLNYLGICSLKTLISISCPMIINVFEKDLFKISSMIKDIILALLPICEDKSINNQFRIQLISQYIYCIFKNKPLKSEILPLIRRNILSVFMGNDFFKTTKRSLFYWKEIIDSTTQQDKNYSHDLLGQLLARQSGLFQGLLKGKQQVLRQKIKSFQRVCFVIYSGRVDKYQGKLSTVLLFLNQVMKQQNSSPALLILMLFCIRILFMRLSQTSLNKMFKSIWPGLISILIQIFNSKNKNKNINLVLAALKVIELIHALEIQEFNFHKWIFITDFFGIKIEPIGQEQNQMEERRHEILTPFIFKPYMTNLLPDHPFRCEFIPNEVSYRQTLCQRKQKRKIVIKQASIDTIQELQNLAYILMQYIIDCNQKRVQVSRTEIEQLIEVDFINLDDYIFQVK